MPDFLFHVNLISVKCKVNKVVVTKMFIDTIFAKTNGIRQLTFND